MHKSKTSFTETVQILNLAASAMTERHKEPHNAKMQQADFMSILQGLFHLYLMSNAYRPILW